MLVDESRGDEGLGLIELIVGIVVSTIVLVGIASVLVNSWLTQNDVLSTSEATNRGQMISLQIERAVRNAVSVEPRNSGAELWVHTSFNNPVDDDPRTCQAFDLGGQEAALKSSKDNLAIAPWATWVDDDDQAWLVLVEQVGSTPIFTVNGTKVSYTFEIDTDSAPVRFDGDVSMRSSSMGATEPCWP